MGTTQTATYAISGSGIGSTLTFTDQSGYVDGPYTKISEPPILVTPPTCTLTATPASIAPGSSSTLTASCNPAATSYTWTGGTCVGDTGATCTVTPSVTTTYSVAGSNASGTGNSASATVTPFAVQATVVNNVVQAVFTYNSADINQAGKVYIFGYLDANSPLFGTTARQGSDYAMAGSNLVLAVYTASGWQRVLSGGTVEPVYTGTLNSSNSAFSLYVAGLFNQSSDAGIICAAYTTSTSANTTDQGLPVVTGNDPTVTCPSVTLVTLVIEFYNTNLDNYFITANADEAAAIDGGSAGPGWSRTGNTFKSGGSTSVCRFYGSMSPGPNSHFYTADAGECDYLKQLQANTPDTEKRWNFESLDFMTTLPTVAGINGTCPTGTTPVYRAYNNGFTRGVDSNHRIASSQAAIQEVVTRNWNEEGVVMCAPL